MNRKIYKLISSAKQGLFAFALTLFWGAAHSQTTYTFNYTGSSQTISLPAGNYSMECWGADGGSLTANTALPGKGGYSSATFTLSAPTTYTIYVGGKGNGGAQPLGGFNSGNGTTKTNLSNATGGGGATDIRVLVDDVFHRIIVAGGGGGQGTTTGTGGNGGGLIGQNGQGNVANIGIGGTQTAAGLFPGGGDAKPATFGEGGDGPAGTTGGQGGGGWYGGSFGTRTNGGGAGGSGYVLTSISFTPPGYFSTYANYYFTNEVTLRADEGGFVTNPDVSGNGLVLIKEMCSLSLSVTGLDANNAICAGNTVTITTDAISNYSWTTGSAAPFLIVSPGTSTVYGLTATSPSNCTASSQVTINVNPLPTLNINNTAPAVCFGNQVVLSVSGADTYLWSTNSTAPNLTVVPAQSTIYSVSGTYTSTNCSATETVLVDVITITVAVSGNNSICKGSTTSLTANADGATSYGWSNGLTGQSILVSPASHTVYVATAQVSTLNITCTAVNSIQVTVHPTPNIVVLASKTTLCEDEALAISAGGGTAYAWSWGSQTASGANITITPSLSTNFIVNVTGTGTNGCTNTGSVSITVVACTGIGEAGLSNKFEVYPNPTQGEIYVRLDQMAAGSSLELQLINETGQLIRNIILSEENGYTANISGLSNGIYFIAGQNGTQRINKKVVVNR